MSDYFLGIEKFSPFWDKVQSDIWRTRVSKRMRTHAKVLHPDKPGGNAEAYTVMMNQYHEILSRTRDGNAKQKQDVQDEKHAKHEARLAAERKKFAELHALTAEQKDELEKRKARCEIIENKYAFFHHRKEAANGDAEELAKIECELKQFRLDMNIVVAASSSSDDDVVEIVKARGQPRTMADNRRKRERKQKEFRQEAKDKANGVRFNSTSKPIFSASTREVSYYSSSRRPKPKVPFARKYQRVPLNFDPNEDVLAAQYRRCQRAMKKHGPTAKLEELIISDNEETSDAESLRWEKL